VPVIEPGRPLTVTTTDLVQPNPNEYIIVDVPAAAPYTVQLVLAGNTGNTVATDVLLLVHVPPPARSDKVVVPFTHTLSMPLIGDGAVFTVTTVEAVQPATVV
jgi:hypothetical protein